MALVPQYVSTGQNQAAFIPGGALPIILPTGTYITDQTTLDAVTLAAGRAGVTLNFSGTAPSGYNATGTSVSPVVPGSPPADGQVLVWSATLQQWVPSSQAAGTELVSAVNATGTTTALATANGAPTMTAIPGTAITVPASGGRNVYLEWEALFQQTVAGVGNVWLAVYTGGTSIAGSMHILPNSTNFAGQFVSGFGKNPIGVVAAPTTYQLYAGVAAPAGANGVLFNSAAYPSLLRAVTS